MTDVQFTAILSALTVVGGALVATLRWAVGRVVQALDDNAKALTGHAVAAAVQAEASRHQADALRDMEAVVREVHDWCDKHTGVHELPRGIREKKRTPAKGIGEYHVRGRTHPEDE